MPSVLIRNMPPELHARLKSSAAANRRSLTQEVIVVVEKGLAEQAKPVPRKLPEPIPLKRPTTMEETLRFIDEGQR